MELLNKIQRELKAPKSQFNSFGKYKYRNCEDILEAVKPLLGDGMLVLNDELVQLGDRYYVKATAYLHDGDILRSATAYAREALDKKGMDEAQITGAASSYARKYALNGLFLIDDTKDADNEDNTKVEKKEDINDIVPSTAKPAWQRPIKSADKILKEKKAAIADLLNSHPTVLSPLKDKEDYAEACARITGIDLNDTNVDAILKELIAATTIKD